MNAAQLSERARALIITQIQTNISAELAAIRTDRADNSISTEAPGTSSYFIFAHAITYQTPAIFIVVDSGEVLDSRENTNYVNINWKLFVTVTVSSQTEASVTVKSERYLAALFKILHETDIKDATHNVHLYLVCKRFEFGRLYTKSRKSENMADFYKEVGIELEVKHWENPTS